jgi:spore coat protein SA
MPAQGLPDPGLDFVPPEVEAFAQQVLTHYNMNVHTMTLITSKPDKGGAIWRIETDKGPRSLKLLHRRPSRSLFSIYAQKYLVAKGARVPALISTKQGNDYVEAGGKLWIVTDWIEPLYPAAKDLEGMKKLCYGLGEFQRHSRGYVPPKGAEKASRIKRWPSAYQKMIMKMNWFRAIAKAYSEMPASSVLLSVLDKYEQQAKDALTRLMNSNYSRLISREENSWGIVHQDYGWSNGQIGPDGNVWIIDLDGVAYDLPVRDLRKLITSTMDDMGYWDVQWMKETIAAYHEAYPIEPEVYEILLIDMALPNEFYKLVKEMVYEPSQFLNETLVAAITRIEQAEASKWQALRELTSGFKGGGNR